MGHIFNRDTFFEDSNDRIDKPIDYNHLIASLFGDILDTLLEQNIIFVDGIGYHLDTSRNKFLSVNRHFITAGAYGLTVTDRYLKVAEVPTAGDQGLRMMRAGTLTGIVAKSRSSAAWELEVRKNGVPITLVNLSVAGGGTSNPSIDVDFAEGDHIQIFAEGINISHPIVQIEYAWRIDAP